MPITKNFGLLAKIPLTDKAIMREVGLLARERIIRRTVSGESVDGSRFKAYSPGYAKAKARELGAGPVNLQLSGGMLNAIQVTEVGDDYVELGFV